MDNEGDIIVFGTYNDLIVLVMAWPSTNFYNSTKLYFYDLAMLEFLRVYVSHFEILYEARAMGDES